MTGRPFLTTAPAHGTYTGLRVALEVVWAADLSDADGSSWTWTDITDDLVFEEDGGEVSITLGRADESSDTQTALMVCRLDNRDRAYSAGGMSANWPNVRPGVPVRVRVSTDNGSTWKLRFQGTAVGFTPFWDEDTGRWATVELSASGPLRRLEQGTPFTKSSIRVALENDPTTTSYWPCEDPGYAVSAAAAVNGDAGQGSVGQDDLTTGKPGEFASFSGFVVSAPVLTMGQMSGIICPVKSTVSTSQSTVKAIFHGLNSVRTFDEGPGLNGVIDPYTGNRNSGKFLRVSTPNGGSIKTWFLSVQVWPGTETNFLRMQLDGYSSTNPTSAATPDQSSGRISMTDYYGGDAEVGLILSQDGSSTDWRWYVRTLDGTVTTSFTGSWGNSGSSAPTVSEVRIAPYRDCTGLAVGHIVVTNDDVYPPTAAMIAPYSGYVSERPEVRVERLAGESNIHLDVLDYPGWGGNFSIANSMGVQQYGTLTELLRECERTGAGFLFDGWGPGLTYVTKEYRERQANQPAALTVDATSQLMEPFGPIDDDQVIANNVIASQKAGASASYADVDGLRGVNVIGDYSTSIEVNSEETDDADAIRRYAEWRVSQGTREGYRYPTISFALETNPTLIPGWLACTPCSRLDVTNISDVRRQHASEPIRLVLDGWIETISLFAWRVTANTARQEPWNVAKLASATGSTGDAIGRMQTVASQLNANASAGATSVVVRTTSGNRWVTTGDDGGSDNFPFYAEIGGCRVQVTNITGTSTSGQTFTLASPGLPRAMTGSTTTGQGASVKVWRPPVFGL